MSRKTLVILLVVIAVAVGTAYSLAQDGQPAQPSTNTANCSPENLAGNFTSSPEMNNTSSGPYSLTFYVQNMAPQSTTITGFTDTNGLTAAVNWTAPGYTETSFTATINKPESSLILKTACGTLLPVQAYYPTPSRDHATHYEVTLFVSLGNTAH